MRENMHDQAAAAPVPAAPGAATPAGSEEPSADWDFGLLGGPEREQLRWDSAASAHAGFGNGILNIDSD